jgi:putative transposase
MPLSLKRYQSEGDDHFITFSCYHRELYFTTPIPDNSS